MIHAACAHLAAEISKAGGLGKTNSLVLKNHHDFVIVETSF